MFSTWPHALQWTASSSCPLQSALRARVEHLAARAEDGLCQTEKQGDPDEHHGNREQLAAHASEQRDVAKARRGERGYREVERVNKVLDLRIDPMLRDKDQRGDHEHEHGQVQCGADDLLIAAHDRELLFELTEHVVGAEQPDSAKDAQEAEIAAER